jgi:hypothetical protein
VLVLIVGMTVQLHMSAMVLAAMSLMLWWRGLVKLSWSGVATGALPTAASPVPWVQLIVERPELPFPEPDPHPTGSAGRHVSDPIPLVGAATPGVRARPDTRHRRRRRRRIGAVAFGRGRPWKEQHDVPACAASANRRGVGGGCPTRTRGSSAITRCTAISGLSIGAASWSSARGAGGRMRCRLRDPNRLRRLVLEGRRVSRCPVRR